MRPHDELQPSDSGSEPEPEPDPEPEPIILPEPPPLSEAVLQPIPPDEEWTPPPVPRFDALRDAFRYQLYATQERVFDKVDFILDVGLKYPRSQPPTPKDLELGEEEEVSSDEHEIPVLIREPPDSLAEEPELAEEAPLPIPRRHLQKCEPLHRQRQRRRLCQPNRRAPSVHKVSQRRRNLSARRHMLLLARARANRLQRSHHQRWRRPH